jgi:hypothetical protein
MKPDREGATPINGSWPRFSRLAEIARDLAICDKELFSGSRRTLITNKNQIEFCGLYMTIRRQSPAGRIPDKSGFGEI